MQLIALIKENELVKITAFTDFLGVKHFLKKVPNLLHTRKNDQAFDIFHTCNIPQVSCCD